MTTQVPRHLYPVQVFWSAPDDGFAVHFDRGGVWTLSDKRPFVGEEKSKRHCPRVDFRAPHTSSKST
jgi:hypothetical protein